MLSYCLRKLLNNAADENTYKETFLWRPIKHLDDLAACIAIPVKLLVSNTMSTSIGTFRSRDLIMWRDMGHTKVGIATLFLEVVSGDQSFFFMGVNQFVNHIAAAVWSRREVVHCLVSMSDVVSDLSHRVVGDRIHVLFPTVL